MADDGLRIINTVDNSQLEQGFRNARTVIRQSADAAVKEGERIDATFDKIGKTAAAMVAGFEVKSFIQKVVQIRGEFQQLEVAFTTMLGSAEKANALMNQLVKTAASTPFDLKGVADGAKQLLAYGVAADEVNDTLIHLGDIAAGLSLPLGDLVYLYGTTITQGRMYTQDLRQFMGRGIPLAEELAKQFGVTKDKVSELVTAGKVGADEFKKAIMSMSSEGGKFGGLMEAQSKTITGQISNIEDSIDVMFNNIGKQSEGIINDTLSVVSSLVENYEKVGKVLISLVAVYGTYKAAMMTAIALQNLQALGVSALTTKEAIHYGWLVVTRKAQLLLNASMLTNPYVLMATAIAGVVAALVMMKSQQELVTEAENAYNEDKDEAIRKEEEHANKINELCRIAGDESLSTENRRLALVQLEQKYPSIFAKYDTEYDKLSNILAIKKEIAVLDGQNSIKNPTNELYNVNKRINELEAKGAAKYQTTTTTTGAYFTTQVGGRSKNEEAELQMLQQKRKQLQTQIHKANLTGISNPDLEKQINERRNLLAKMQTTGKKYGRVQMGGATGVYNENEIQDQLQILEAEQKRRKDIITNGARDFVAEARKAYKAEEAELKKLRSLTDPKKRAQSNMQMELGGKMMKVSEMTADQFADAVKKQQEKVDEAAKKIKGLTGQSVKGENSAAKKEQAERERNQRAYENAERAFAKVKENLTMELSQSFVDIEENTAARELAQIKHDHEQEMAEFEREKEEYIQKKIELEQAKAKASGKTYTTSINKEDVLSEDEKANFSKLKANLTAKHGQEESEYYKQASREMYDYLREYGTFQQKRFAITEEYAAKIAEARKKGEIWNVKSLESERDSKLQGINTELLKQQIDWQSVLGGFTGMLGDQLKTTLESLKEYIKTPEFAGKDETDKQIIYSSIEQLRGMMGGGSGTLNFSDLKKQMDSLGVAVNNLQQAKLHETESLNQLKAAQDAYEKAVKSGDKAQIEAAKSNLTLAENVADGASNTVKIQTQAVQNLATNLSEAEKDTVDGLNMVADGLQGFASNTLSGAFAGIQNMLNGLSKLNIGGKVGEAIGSLSETLSSAGVVGQIISAILSILDILKDGIGTLIANLIDTILNSVNGILSNILSLDFVGQIGGSLVKGVGNILNTVTFGGFNSLFGVGGNEKEVAEREAALVKSQENLQRSVDKLRESFDKQNGQKAIDTADQMIKDQKEYNELQWERFANEMGYHSSHHSNDYEWEGFSDEQIRRMNQIFSEHGSKDKNGNQAYISGRSWRELGNLSPEAMDDLRTYGSEIWDWITSRGKYGEVYDQLNAYADLAGKIEEIEENLRQKMTMLSDTTLHDQFLSELMDMEKDAEDFGENFTDILAKAVLNAQIGDLMDDSLKEWREEMSKRMQKEGGLTSGDVSDLRTMWDDIVQKGIEARDNMIRITGYDSKDPYQQQASTKGFQAMSQDTGNELNGRFTAIQIGVYDIKDLAVNTQEMLAEMKNTQGNISTRVEAIQEAIALSNVHLSKIEKHTKNLEDFGEILEEIRDNTKKL